MTIDATDSDENLDLVANLDGTWKSDWLLTKQHIDAECQLSEEQTLGLERLLGKMTVRYAGTRAEFTLPEIRYTKAGKEYLIEGGTWEEGLNVVSQTKSQIALLSKAIMFPIDQDSIQLIHFENADTYWVYLGHSPFVGLHVREYFCRQAPQ